MAQSQIVGLDAFPFHSATYSVYPARPRLCHCYPASSDIEDLTTMSQPVSFTQFICCNCHDTDPACIATTFFSNCTFLAVRCVRQQGRVSGVSPRCTESLGGRRTKRLDWLELLGSGQCGRRGAEARQVIHRPRYQENAPRSEVHDISIFNCYIVMLHTHRTRHLP